MLKSTVNFDWPLFALMEYMYSMLSTPLICCSIGVATDWSRVTASAPGYVAVTWIWGSAILGNCALGRLRMATAPTMTMTIEITMATMGRSMKNFDMGQVRTPRPSWPARAEPCMASD